MKKITVKANSKVNLTLDILGVSGGYHLLSSLVCSTALSDTITVRKRKDDLITLKNKGIKIDCSLIDNNAYKTAKLFQKTFNTSGVDIIIDKRIPLGGGLGGSSADIAGVLNAMKKLFNVSEGLEKIANELSSDACYMLKGGYAVMSGRGDKVEYLNTNKKLYFVVFTDKNSVSSRACYKRYDELNISTENCTEQVLNAFNENDEKFFGLLKNDLYKPATTLNSNIELNLIALKNAGAKTAIMTGSGSAVLGVFNDKKERDNVYKILIGRFGNKILKTETV